MENPGFSATPSHDEHVRSMQLDGFSTKESTNSIRFTTTANLDQTARISDNDSSNGPSSFLHSQHHEGTAATSSPAEEIFRKCIVDACTYKGSFKSAYERARHIQAVHGGESAKIFVCGARGCFNRRVLWSFARFDKLTSHIKMTHNYSTTFNNCPVAACAFGPCTLEDLGVHIHRAHKAHRALEECRAVLNATPCKTRRCPLWRCGKHLVAGDLLAHIQLHASDDLEAAKSSLETEGFIIQRMARNGMAVQVVCPVCRAITTDTTQFTRHLVTDHLQTSISGGYKHFEEWKGHWHQNIPKAGGHEIKNLLPWSRIHEFPIFEFRGKRFKCPCCPFSVSVLLGSQAALGYDKIPCREQKDKHALIREHHLSFLRPEAEVVAELYPHRMAILRLWPEFVTHPVFADFDQLQQQSTSIIPEM